ncbi:gfo/Idh/MocA family oxidoreductase [Opitutaceae bacterium EW11]|nr:gfo/Idh/MocA family oxidoreductase [Opitutaceae bacterium EW11]
MSSPLPANEPAGLDRRAFLKTVSAAGLGLALTRATPAWAQAKADGSVSPNSILNIALVGVGAQGRVLMDAVLKIPTVRIVAVCDIWEYARTYGQRYLKKSGFEVRAYENHHDMLAKEKDIQAVLVATPDFWHAPVTNDCLRAGLHVYCEKMMSNTIEGARSMVKTMRETGKLLQIGHQRRSNPRYLVARDRLIRDAKLLGRITAANAQWNRAASDDLGWPNRAAMSKALLEKYGFEDMHQFRNWRWYKKYGGGPLSDLGAHQIDIFNWFFDTTPTTVIGNGGRDYYPNHEWMDNAMVIYEYHLPEGVARAFYQVQTTTSAGGGYYEQFMGVNGTLKMSENPKYTSIFREAAAPAWDEWIRRHWLAAPTAPASAADTTEASSEKVDARETAELASYRLPVVLNKAIHQPHLENFFNAIRGTAKLNCPADEAFKSEMTVFKAIEAVEKKTLITCTPEDFAV